MTAWALTALRTDADSRALNGKNSQMHIRLTTTQDCECEMVVKVVYTELVFNCSNNY